MLENAHFPPKDICFPTVGGPCQYNNARGEKKEIKSVYIGKKVVKLDSRMTWSCM